MPDALVGSDLYGTVQSLLRGQATLRDVEKVLDGGANPNEWNGPLTPLRYSVQAHHAKLMQLLLAKGADANKKDSKGVAPLHMAVFDGKGDCVRVLLDSGAEVNVQDRHGQSPLFFAPSRQLCQLLMRSKADVNMRNKKRQTPLHLAAHAGLNGAVAWLADVGDSEIHECVDDNGRNPLDYASHAQCKSTIEVLESRGGSTTSPMRQNFGRRTTSTSGWSDFGMETGRQSSLGRGVSNSVSNSVSNNVSNNVANNVSNNVANNVSNSVSRNVSNNVSNEIPATTQTSPERNAPNEVSATMPTLQASPPRSRPQQTESQVEQQGEDTIGTEVEAYQSVTPTITKQTGEYVLTAGGRMISGSYIWENGSNSLSDLQTGTLLGRLSCEPIAQQPLKTDMTDPAWKKDTAMAEMPCISVMDSEVMTEIQKPANSGAFFVVPSQLNGAEYPDYTYVVRDIAEYRGDNTYGPRAQLAVHPALGQFILDNAACESRSQGINAVENLVEHCQAYGFRCMNGYLRVPRIAPAYRERALQAFVEVLHTMRTICIEGCEACGLKPDKRCFVDTRHTVNLIYASAVPVQAFLNMGDVDFEVDVAQCVLIAQYYGALKTAAQRSANKVTRVYLMPLGSGAFQNPWPIIVKGMAIAVEKLTESERAKLDIRVLTWSGNPQESQHVTAFLQQHNKLSMEAPVLDPVMHSEMDPRMESHMRQNQRSWSTQAQVDPRMSRSASSAQQESDGQMDVSGHSRGVWEGCQLWDVVLRKDSGSDKYGFVQANGKFEFEARLYGEAQAESGNMLAVQGPEVLIVKRIHQGGLLDHWNQMYPEAQVRPLDRIYAVNGRGTVTEMHREIRSRKIVLRCMRYPERFKVSLDKNGRMLGFRYEKPHGMTGRPADLRISEVLGQGLIADYNQHQVSKHRWHLAILPEMRIEAVNDINDSAEAISMELKTAQRVVLQLRRVDQPASQAFRARSGNTSRGVATDGSRSQDGTDGEYSPHRSPQRSTQHSRRRTSHSP